MLCVTVAPSTDHAGLSLLTLTGRHATPSPCSRFSAENSSEPKPDPHSKPPPAASQSPARGSRAGGDWLGLKDEDFLDSEPPSPAKTSPVVSSQQLLAKEATSKPNQLEEDNWLSAALSRKKAQAQVKAQERSAVPLETTGKGLDPSPAVR